VATYLNHVAIAAPRNGTTSHTVTPSSGAVVAGTLFTPTAGNLLLCFAEGAVSSSTPSGWTLPSGAPALGNTGFYVWYRTAAGSDTITSTHNGSNYPVVFHFIEFAAGSTFVQAANATGTSPSGAPGPELTGLTGAPWVAAGLGQGHATTSTYSVTWAAGAELADTTQGWSSGQTDGYVYSLTYAADYGPSAWSAAATSTLVTHSCERLVVAVVVAASSGGGTSAVAGAGEVAALARQGTGTSAAGVGTVTAKATQRAGSAVSGVGAVAATASGATSGTAAVAGTGTVAAVAVVAAPGIGSAAVAGVGAVTALARLGAPGSVAGGGTVVATGTVLVPSSGTATVAGTGAVSASGSASEPVAPTWLLRPPTVPYRAPGVRWSIPRGLSLVVTGSTVRAKQWVESEEVDVADHFYLGGHEHIVSEAEATVLTDAGYGSYLTPNL
jgi:hypothetical protein